jgi:hypothetical protein
MDAKNDPRVVVTNRRLSEPLCRRSVLGPPGGIRSAFKGFGEGSGNQNIQGTPKRLYHTVLSGGRPASLRCGCLAMRASVSSKAGLALGSRVMFAGFYGVVETGASRNWPPVSSDHLALAPDAVDGHPIKKRKL